MTPRTLLPLAPTLLLWLAACADAPRRTPVMILVLDATHAAHVGAYGGRAGLTPTLDSVAERGVRFERAFSNANWTLPSTACLMTGRFQEQHRVVSRFHRIDPDQALLAETLDDLGYRTSCWTQMPYAGKTYGFGRGYDEFHFYGDRRPGEAGVGGPPLFAALRRWLGSVEGEPWFAYVHLRRPHSPYDPPSYMVEALDPDGPLSDGSQDERLARADTFAHRELPADERARVETLYLANLATADRAVADIVREVERQEALLIVLSDHGEALGGEGVFGHGVHLADDNIDVPLIVEGPGIEPGVVAEPVCSVDVFPTVLDWLDAPVPPTAELAGRSFLPALTGRGELAPRGPVIVSGKHGLGDALQVAAVDGDLKLVLETDGSTAAFERTAGGDRPFEGPVPERLAELVRDWQREHAQLLATDRVDEELDEEERLELERLGYLEPDGVPVPGTDLPAGAGSPGDLERSGRPEGADGGGPERP